MAIFELFDDDSDTVETVESNAPKVRNPPLQCSVCGRFAKYGGGRHYYNGHFNCYSYDTICSQCGTVTVECV